MNGVIFYVFIYVIIYKYYIHMRIVCKTILGYLTIETQYYYIAIESLWLYYKSRKVHVCYVLKKFDIRNYRRIVFLTTVLVDVIG